jgi:hypothetical protein
MFSILWKGGYRGYSKEAVGWCGGRDLNPGSPAWKSKNSVKPKVGETNNLLKKTSKEQVHQEKLKTPMNQSLYALSLASHSSTSVLAVYNGNSFFNKGNLMRGESEKLKYRISHYAYEALS